MQKGFDDEIFGGKSLCELSREDLIEFGEREEQSCREIMSRYSLKEEELEVHISSRTKRTEYSTCKGITLNRGIYHPGDGFELAVSNIGRGHKLKKAPDGGGEYYYCFCFDENDELLCAEKYEGKGIIQREYIIHENGREYGLIFQWSGLENIYAAEYNGGQLKYTYHYDKYSRHISDVCLYDYDENGRRSTVGIVFNFVNQMCRLDLYDYEYDDLGNLLGLRCGSGHFISVKGKHARKYITAAKTAEAMKKVLSEWGEFPDDVYALSVYYEDNESNGTSAFHLGFNTEEAAGGFDADDEVRWNYAFWLQNEKPLFDDSVYVRNIENCGSLAVLANAVKQLHSFGIITEIFGRELPVIIHELEYYPEIAEYNIKANGKQLLPKEFIEFCGC